MKPLCLCLLFSAAVAKTNQPYIPGRAFDRFVTIWLENQDFSRVSENDDIKLLAREGISQTNYYALTHPSQPNYLASIAGDYFGLDHDDFVELPGKVTTLIDLFDVAPGEKISWKGYFEDLPGPGYMGMEDTPEGASKTEYVRKHKYVFEDNLPIPWHLAQHANNWVSPFVSFNSIGWVGERLANIQSLDAFQRALAAEDLPQYIHISPNLDNDGHDTSLESGANWTSNFLKPLLGNHYFMNNTLVQLTYDEAETYSSPNKVVSILLGDAIPFELRGTTDDTFYTHYSIISTLTNNWNLHNLGRYDVGANVFDFVAKQTNWTFNHPPDQPEKSINFSLSYGGYLNSDKDKVFPIPEPNLMLTVDGTEGGMGVHPKVNASWRDSNWNGEAKWTPYDGSGRVFQGGDDSVGGTAPLYGPQKPNYMT